MSVKSVLGFREISVTKLDPTGPYTNCVDIHLQGDRRIGGTFDRGAVEQLINELAAAIGEDVALTKPKLTLRDLEPGTAFRFGDGTNRYAPLYVLLTGDRLANARSETVSESIFDSDYDRTVTVVEAAG